jgi:probable HAF family extracellular repeat protein
MRSKRCAFLAALLSVLAASAPALGASIHRIRDLLGIEARSVFAVSDDGSVVVGQGDAGAFRWTSDGGMAGLGTLGGAPFFSGAQGVSDDGSVVVGWSYSDASGREAFRWTSAGGMIGLGDLPGGRFDSEAKHVSGDGSVVVGGSSSASGYVSEAFRWTSDTGMVGLGDLPGGDFQSGANASSRDGSVVVGYGSSASGSEAFRWTSAGGMVGLGVILGGGGAWDVSGDGSTIVGEGGYAPLPEAFRWSSDSGMVGLGLLPGDYFVESRAFGVSDDGSAVVGYNEFASPAGGGREAFYWTSGGGMQRLWDVLVAEGVNPADDGWGAFNIARGISADGTMIFGRGLYNGFEEDFLAFIPGVPEPPRLALLALAAPALLCRRQCRHRRGDE